MKLAVYEMSNVEKPYFQKFSREFGVDLITTGEVLTMENVSVAEGCRQVTILGMSRVGEEILVRLKEMGVTRLSTRTIGCDHIDMEAAKRVGIQVSNACYDPYGVAEFAVMLMLMVLRNYKPALWRQQVNDYSLEGLMGRELRTMTVGIIGTGRIGRTVIEILKGFGCRILAFDIEEREDVRRDASYVSVEELFEKSDIISLHMPLMDTTRNMINRETLSAMKESVIIINTARGELIDTNALIERLEMGKIGGLGLDVLAEEQGLYHYDRKTEIIRNREMSYLRQFPNVILTQHMAFYTEADIRDMVKSCFQ